MRPTNLTIFLLLFLALPSLGLAQTEDKSILFPALNYTQHPLVKFRPIRTRSLPLIQSLLPYAPLPVTKADTLDEQVFLRAYYIHTIQKAVQLGLTDRQIVSDSLALKILDEGKLPEKAYRLFTSRTKRYDKSKMIRYTLNKGLPVLVGFENAPIWDQVAGSEYWDGQGTEKPHRMIIIGYDSRTSSFQLVDAHGQRWGQQGTIWMTSIDLLDNAKEVVSFRDPTLVQKARIEAPLTINLELSIRASALLQPESSSAYLKEMEVKFDGKTGYYTFPKTTINPDHGRYQIAIDLPRGRCAYLFVAQPDGTATPAWMMEYNLKDTTVVLPPVSYYQFPDEGSNYLFLLFSSQPIPRWRRFVDRYEFNEKNQNAKEKLYASLRYYLLPQEEVNYQSDQIKASARVLTNAEKQVIPIIIEWEVEHE